MDLSKSTSLAIVEGSLNQDSYGFKYYLDHRKIVPTTFRMHPFVFIIFTVSYICSMVLAIGAISNL
jgi:hypothetical protein